MRPSFMDCPIRICVSTNREAHLHNTPRQDKRRSPDNPESSQPCDGRSKKRVATRYFTIVPIFSPITARWMLPFSCIENTMIGMLLSMHRENAVESMMFRRLPRHSA